MKKRLLVTGASGFIGTNFLKRLAGEGHPYDVKAVFHKRKPVTCDPNVKYLQADLRSLSECLDIVKDTDYICMLAGRLSTAAILRDNPLGPVTENTIVNVQMLEAAHQMGVEKFMWLSSTTGYSASDQKLKEEEFFDSEPQTPYEAMGWMVRYIEKLSTIFAKKSKKPMTVISLRPTAVFGEHDDFNYETCHALPALMRRVIERQSPIEIWGTGEDERDWLYVDDLIDACLLSLEKVEGVEVFNIGSSKVYSLNELLKLMLEIDSYKGATVTHRSDKGTKVFPRRFDCSRAERLLGFKAKTSIKESLAKTMKWYRDKISQEVVR